MLKQAILNNILQIPQELQEPYYELEINEESLQISNGNYVICNLTKLNENKTINFQKTFKIHLKGGFCVNCVNLMGKRYSSIIQLRNGSKRENKLDIILNEIKMYTEKINRDNPSYNIVDIIETNNGYDLKLSNISILKKIHSYIESRYNFIVKKSKTLVGVNSNTGGNLYRTCLLLRTLPVIVGDQILYKNEKYIVKRISQKNVHLENLKNKQSVFKKFKFFEKKDIKIFQEM
jgi:nonsense-mediated mRNA decay protein 3